MIRFEGYSGQKSATMSLIEGEFRGKYPILIALLLTKKRRASSIHVV